MDSTSMSENATDFNFLAGDSENITGVSGPSTLRSSIFRLLFGVPTDCSSRSKSSLLIISKSIESLSFEMYRSRVSAFRISFSRALASCSVESDVSDRSSKLFVGDEGTYGVGGDDKGSNGGVSVCFIDT